MEADQNLNIASRVTEKTHFGYSTFINFCTGKQADVPWSGADWITFGAVVAVIVFAICLIGVILFSIWNER